MWKGEKYMNYMDNINQAIKEYFNILEPEFPNWLNDYINIKELLKEKGKTKYWLIKNMEGSYQSISHMMNNETTGIKFETIEKLCKLLECTPNDLFKLK